MAFTKIVGAGIQTSTDLIIGNVQAGIITATKFVGDISDATGAAAGLGTALSQVQASPLNKLYYTNTVLSVGSTITVDPPSSSNIAYTQYSEIAVEEGYDLIVEDGDDLVPDILGLSTETAGLLSGAGGRVRADNFTNKAGTGAPTFEQGAIVNAGTATTALIVNGDARVTGILTIGTSSITLDGSENQVNVGTGVTLHHTNGVQVGGNTVHSTGITVNNINASGIITASSFSGDGSALTGIAATTNVRTNSLVVSGITTVAAGSTSAPSISPTGDSNTGIFFPSADTIAFGEGGAEAARFNSAGYLGIGTNNPAARLHSIGGTTSGSVDTAAIFTGGVINTIGSGARIVLSGVPGFETIRGTYIEGVFDTATNAHSLRFGTNASTAAPVERLRIDNGGRLITGNSGFTTTSAYGSTTQYSNLHIIGGAGTNNGGGIFIARNTPSTNADNQDLGGIYWGTNDGKTYARIASWVDGTSTASSNPGYISFQTTADGGTSPTERLRIDSKGHLGINGAVPSDQIMRINFGTGSAETAGIAVTVYQAAYPGTSNQKAAYFYNQSYSASGGASYGVWTESDNPSYGQSYALYAKSAGYTYGEAAAIYGDTRHPNPGGPGTNYCAIFRTRANSTGSPLGSIKGVFIDATPGSGTVYESMGLQINTASGPTSVVPIIAYHAGSQIFQVKSNGGINNYSGNNTNLSDERKKKNIEPLESTWDCLKNWNLKQFHFIHQDDNEVKHYGVIAQQVQPYCPEVVTEWLEQSETPAGYDENGNLIQEAKEKISWLGVSEQKMTWMSIKAFQEAQERIEQLEAQNAALTARLDAAGL